MEEEVTRAKKKKTGTKKKKASSKKKASASSTALKLSSEEKKLIKDYRKCSSMEKMLIRAITEKASGTLTKDTDLNSLKNIL